MYLDIQQAASDKFRRVVFELFQAEMPELVLAFPPSLEMGDLSITSCFDLARQLHQPPRKIAEQVAARMLPIDGVENVTIAGPGYINLRFDRAALARALWRLRAAGRGGAAPVESADEPKILVEHTSINPNKAAHIGHLRNAVLGDTLVRLLRFRGHRVEVQNYIDNTGVQVADVVIGLAHLEKKSLDEVRQMAESRSAPRFDYYCWDLYARVSHFYETTPDASALRSETLKAIESGEGALAAMAAIVSKAITRLHLETMQRLNVRYDLLVEESEILRLNFWKTAFDLMKRKGAVYYEEAGKNRGCWVMNLAAEEPTEPPAAGSAEEDVKIIVRSNGTVTYVGKDIAYHLWKFALLDQDFQYQRFYSYPGGADVWWTSKDGEAGAPSFGRGQGSYSVIDSRQAYLQEVVRRAFLALGYAEAAAHLRHFSYEMVGLSLRCAEEMGLDLGDDDRRKNYVEVSGRKGLGVKAEDLIEALIRKAFEEVRSRHPEVGLEEQNHYARMIAVGALRYFLLKYTRSTLIAFDFKDALAFEGETGPYLQYTVVRARNIFRKLREVFPSPTLDPFREPPSQAALREFLGGQQATGFWELILLSAQLEMTAEQAILTEEPATLAKYSFRLAQAFNNFYHHHHILHEKDSSRQHFLLFLVILASETLSTALDLLGIEAPTQM